MSGVIVGGEAVQVGPTSVGSTYIKSKRVKARLKSDLPGNTGITEGAATRLCSRCACTSVKFQTGRADFTATNRVTPMTKRSHFACEPRYYLVLVCGKSTSPSISSLSAGNHTISARYLGDPSFSASSSETTQSVARAHLTVEANPMSKTYDNSPFTGFTAHFAGLGPPVFITGPAIVRWVSLLSQVITPSSGLVWPSLS